MKRHINLFIFVVFSALLVFALAACGGNDNSNTNKNSGGKTEDTPPVVVPEEAPVWWKESNAVFANIPYGTDPEQTLTITFEKPLNELANKDKFSSVVILSGGGFEADTAEVKKLIADAKQELTKQHFAVIEINFRSKKLSNMLADVHTAISFAMGTGGTANEKKYTKNFKIDTARQGILGYSVGGYLALQYVSSTPAPNIPIKLLMVDSAFCDVSSEEFYTAFPAEAEGSTFDAASELTAAKKAQAVYNRYFLAATLAGIAVDEGAEQSILNYYNNGGDALPPVIGDFLGDYKNANALSGVSIDPSSPVRDANIGYIICHGTYDTVFPVAPMRTLSGKLFNSGEQSFVEFLYSGHSLNGEYAPTGNDQESTDKAADLLGNLVTAKKLI
ncbi:MAG: hypothetical protein LBN25_01145 [Christensenellaceae bacterium]|jgi:predicted esterase|nr:hypothetical protein [Christensenellaceae bacterium]